MKTTIITIAIVTLTLTSFTNAGLTSLPGGGESSSSQEIYRKNFGANIYARNNEASTNSWTDPDTGETHNWTNPKAAQGSMSLSSDSSIYIWENRWKIRLIDYKGALNAEVTYDFIELENFVSPTITPDSSVYYNYDNLNMSTSLYSNIHVGADLAGNINSMSTWVNSYIHIEEAVITNFYGRVTDFSLYYNDEIYTGFSLVCYYDFQLTGGIEQIKTANSTFELVPEPATIVIFGLGIVSLLKRKR